LPPIVWPLRPTFEIWVEISMTCNSGLLHGSKPSIEWVTQGLLPAVVVARPHLGSKHSEHGDMNPRIQLSRWL
jgi:hypothetical protein